MRMIAATVLAVFALAACNQNNTAQNGSATTAPAASSASSGGGIFPDLFGASYRLEATMNLHDKNMPVVMIRDGHKMRMEMDNDQGHQVIIVNPDTQEYLMIMQQPGGRTMAMRMHEPSLSDISDQWKGDFLAKSHRNGSCNVAGENGDVWEHVDDGGANPTTICITHDGIPLRSTTDGQTRLEAIHVQRGPQPGSLFAAPPGVRVMDLGAGAAAAMAQMRAAQQGQGH